MSNGPSSKLEQKERLATLLNDIAVRKDSMHIRTASDIAQENQGRFAKDTTITGADRAVHYPTLPSGPWSGPDPLGVEPPLGFDVNEVPLCGEVFEIERSLGGAQAFPSCTGAEGSDGEQHASISSLPNHLGEVAPAPLASTPSANTAVETPRPPTFRKRNW